MKEPLSLPTGAIQNLRECQKQLDADGSHVGVSRQALEEVLEWADGAKAISSDSDESQAKPTLEARARKIVEDARDEMQRLHNRTLDRDGDYNASHTTYAAIENLTHALRKMPRG